MPIPDASLDSRRPHLALVAAAVVSALIAAAAYAPHLGAGFTSEDFLILAHLSSRDLATTAREELSSPWLGLESVGFWRPVSTLLLAVELRALGPDPARLHALHLVLHSINALLVGLLVVRLVRPKGAPIAAAVVTMLFAIHPLHPSAVLFTGAFATLHGATFSLAALSCFAIATASRHRLGLEICALVSFALALGSYEASAVLPAIALVTVLLVPEQRRPAWRVVPFFVVLVLWFGARQLVLGTPVGGYTDLRARFLTAPLERFADLARAVRVLLHPAFGGDAGLPGYVVALAVAAMALAGGLAVRRGARGALAGLGWIVIFLAPFAFTGLVPATGRYAYLTIAGVLLVLASLDAATTARWPRAGSIVTAVALAVLLLDWLGLVRSYLAANDQASALAAAVRGEVLRVAAEAPAPMLLLIEGHPDFVKSPAGAPVAKVLQYGLAESVQPPFGPLERPLVPIPGSVVEEARQALGALPDVIRYRWDETAPVLARVEPATPPPPVLEVLAIDRAAGLLDATCNACESARLVVLTAVLPFVGTPVATEASVARFAVPAAFLRGVARHQSGPAFFWIEERAGGGPTALSPIGRFSLAGDPLQGFADAAAKIRRGRTEDAGR
jgi:hypothetical protein